MFCQHVIKLWLPFYFIRSWSSFFELLLVEVDLILTDVLLFVQLFDAMSLEEVYPLMKPAALYEEALCLVQENKVAYRSLR